MKKVYLLLAFFLPLIISAQQVEMKNGVITFDPFKKKEKPKQDTVKIQEAPPQQHDDEQSDDESQPKQGKGKKVKDENAEENAEPVKEKKTVSQQAARDKQAVNEDLKSSFFKGLFHVGLNASQIDGDTYSGYNYPGLDAGVGVQVKFHKLLSVSLEMNYSMKGAKQAFLFKTAPQTLQKYMTQADYIEVPVTFNIQDAKYVMFSIGLSPGYMIRYKQRNEQGDDITDNPFFGLKKFDLEGMAALHVFVKQQFGFGLKFAYSLIKLGGPTGNLSRANGRYNNVLTLRFMYILDPGKLKRKTNSKM